MCGIAGYAGAGDEPLLRTMCRALVHRGPDDEGVHAEQGVGLSMRRLAIIDLATGQQPIANEDRTVWVVFNGEIYNYQELRAGLLARGHRLATTGDTETIVHLYEEHGLDFVDHLRGMFAIALWDRTRQRLVLVRDRIGEKPLYYARTSRSLVFGSELNAVLTAAPQPAADRQALCDFLALGYMPGDRSAFAGIRKLPPAHRLVFEAGGVTVTRYWQRSTRRRTIPFSVAAAELAAHLDEGVRLCLRSDVEVGAFLSGGLDSSLLVALMRQHEAQVQTFTVGYRGAASGFNETAHARTIATLLRTQHHELILDGRSSIDLLPTILSHYGEPHGEPTSVLVYQLSQFARERVKVAVGGTGSDEVFFGYPRHKGVRFLQYYRHLPRALRRHVVERVVDRWPESTRGSRFAKRARRFVRGAGASTADAYLAWTRLLDADVHRDLIANRYAGMVEDPAGDRFLRDHLSGTADDTLLDAAAAIDIDGYLPEYQLTYIDRMSMAHGLEVRSPLCDYPLVDFVASLPPDYRLKRFRSKHLLKTVASRWLPAATIDRPKVGFDSPVGQWFKDELRPFLLEFLAAGHVRRTGLLDANTVQVMLGDHLSGRRDYSLQLWSVLVVEAWHRMYMEGGGAGSGDVRLADIRGAERIRQGATARIVVPAPATGAEA